jgi:hypothetical protein
MNAVSVTYQAVWPDCDSSIEWFMAQWVSLATNGQLVGLPAMFRPGVEWTFKLRKEDNAFRAIIREKGVHTPEEDGPACFLLYGPNATIKLRCENPDIADRALTMMYGEMPPITEKLHSQEWAYIASINNGTIPDRHRLSPIEPVLNPNGWNDVIFSQGKDTQRYDKGLERFVGKFGSDLPVTATMG